MRAHKRRRGVAGLFLSLSLVATACDDPRTTGEGPTGTVPIAGSSTVYPITALVAEDYAASSPGANAVVESTGTGGGFSDNFCLGATAINNASRTIKEEEIDLCADNGVTNILELKVGIDGMTVLTSNDNDQVAQCLNFGELYSLLGPESGDVATWADANAMVAELAGHASGEEFPDVPLTTAGPGTESGTYDSFIEIALEGIAEERGVEPGVRPDWTGNNDDNVIIQGLAGNPYSLGWVGYAYYVEIADQLRAFQVAGEDGTCVEPNEETIASGEYPLSRPLYIYVNLDKLDEDYGSALRGLVDYYLSDAGYALVAEAGYVQLTQDAWAETVAAWETQAPNVGA